MSEYKTNKLIFKLCKNNLIFTFFFVFINQYLHYFVETGCAKRYWSDQPQIQRLDHQPHGRKKTFPYLDDGCLLCSCCACLHPHFHGVPDYYVSKVGYTIHYHYELLEQCERIIYCLLTDWLWANLRGRWWKALVFILTCSSWSPWGAFSPSLASPGWVLPLCGLSPMPTLWLSCLRAPNRWLRRWLSRGSVVWSWPLWLVGAAI